MSEAPSRVELDGGRVHVLERFRRLTDDCRFKYDIEGVPFALPSLMTPGDFYEMLQKSGVGNIILPVGARIGTRYVANEDNLQILLGERITRAPVDVKLSMSGDDVDPSELLVNPDATWGRYLAFELAYASTRSCAAQEVGIFVLGTGELYAVRNEKFINIDGEVYTAPTTCIEADPKDVMSFISDIRHLTHLIK